MYSLQNTLKQKVKEGELWERLDEKRIRCYACGHCCPIPEGHVGVCKVRFNRGGKLLVPWGYVGGVQCDPIEKKPFFHAYPGALAYSFGMLGCDLHCGYCQNWVTSQALRDSGGSGAPSQSHAPGAGPGGRKATGPGDRQHLQRASDHQRVGGGGVQGGPQGGPDYRLRLQRQRHAGGAGLPEALGWTSTRWI